MGEDDETPPSNQGPPTSGPETESLTQGVGEEKKTESIALMDGITFVIASYAALVSTGVAVVQWKEARRIARIRKAMKRRPVKPVPLVVVNRERERIGVAIEDSTPIPDDPDGRHTVKVLIENPFFAAQQEGSGNGI